MRYEAALAYVYGLAPRGMKLDLRDVARALRRVGHPERRIRFVHVAGTNGKGSTAAFIEAGLRAAGVRTGLFTSPHLHRWAERIQVAGRPIARSLAAEVLSRVRVDADGPRHPLSFFEATWVAALLAFEARGVEVAVIEVGMGGRLDATNVIRPMVSVISRVADDHGQYLGTTLAQIAREKAGVIKRGVPVLTTAVAREVLPVLQRRAAAERAPLAVLRRDFGVRGAGPTRTLWCDGEVLEGVGLGLAGAHQWENAALAFAALTRLREAGLTLPDRALRRGFAHVTWPARLEALGGRPAVLVDAAHNPDGARALARHLAGLPPRRRVLLFGAMADKPVRRMLRILAPHVDAVVYPSLPLPRSAAPADLARIVPGAVASSPRAGLALARRLAGPRGEVIVAGSLFLVGPARALVKHLGADPPIRM